MLSALALARALDAGETTLEAVYARCREAIEAREEDIRAFVHLDLEAAEREAAGARGPLRGLPAGIKDIFDTADMPTAHGSPVYAGNRPLGDAALVAMIRRAGGVVAAKTVTTEFAFFQPGPTRNPHDLGHTPGGSSSGSAAAVAAGMLPLSTGSQTGGSVVRPAAFCGIAGFKPTFDLLPTAGMKTFSWSLDTAGLFAAHVDDVAWFAAGVTGRDWRTDERDPGAPRVAVVHSHVWHEASGEMRVAVDRATRLAEKAGARVTTLELAGVFSEAFAAHGIIQDFEAAQALAYEADRHANRLSPILTETLEVGRRTAPDEYDRALASAARARHAVAALFEEADVLLAPSAPGAAPAGLGSTGSSIFNRLWTLMGTPCVNVPGLENDAGLPLGVQLIAPRHQDARVLRAASWLERCLRRG